MSSRLHHLAAARFEAARTLPGIGRHGHGFSVQAAAIPPRAEVRFPGGELGALEAALAAAVAPLDYTDLNRRLDLPDDAALATWIAGQLPDRSEVLLQSTPSHGAICTGRGTLAQWCRFRFEAAHRLPKVPATHKCGRMHGHGFEIVIRTGDPVAAAHGRIATAWAPLAARLDGACLNELPGLENPTSEMLAVYLWQELHAALPALERVTVHETRTAGCHYDGRAHRIWIDQSFESAVRLKQAPGTHRASRLHGHSYLLRLELAVPLDAALGWTLDYGDVKAAFKPIYRQLDHVDLAAHAGIADGDAGSVLAWIRGEVAQRLPHTAALVLHATPGCGARLDWGDDVPLLMP
ncbi:MAG: 6-carboxytetrahydropterin synthase [Gammaproteobacteria bacterium]|nr:6-carboxytetrahydropterin synthase [Gammaproteobacteria bacterium]MBI5619324.1 6-carboxytetrahydropterin synthase [Gammaproteobacteria bacterium]